MKLRKIEVASYAVVGAGCCVIGAIIIGIVTQNALDKQPLKRDRFNANFWSLTVPCLAIVGFVSTGAAHMIISSLKQSYFQALEPEPDQPTNQPPQPPTRQPTRFPLPVIDLSPEQPQPTSQPSQPTNQQVSGADEAYRNGLNALIGGRNDFGG